MNVQRLRWPGHWVMLVASVLVYLAGCSTIPPSPGRTPLPAIHTPSLRPISSPSPEPPTRTSPTPSPVLATHTPYPPPPTSTLAPALPPDQERAFVVGMLETNGGCELPCWWGITPGETDWQTVRSLFASLGKRTNDIPYSDGTIGHGSRNFEVSHPEHLDHLEYYVAHTFVERDGRVQSVEVKCEVFRDATSEQFARDWHRYSLDQVLTRYGLPSQVMLELWPNPPEPYYPYRLFVFYEHLGILIEYEGPAIPGEPFRICPVFEQVNYLRLWLQSPERGIPLLQLANLDPLEQAQMLPLEEATGMDIQTFYETFRQAGTTACLESPAEIWP